MKTTESISKYTLADLIATMPDEPHAVRDEAAKRQNRLAKKFSAIKQQMTDYEMLYKSAIIKIG